MLQRLLLRDFDRPYPTPRRLRDVDEELKQRLQARLRRSNTLDPFSRLHAGRVAAWIPSLVPRHGRQGISAAGSECPPAVLRRPGGHMHQSAQNGDERAWLLALSGAHNGRHPPSSDFWAPSSRLGSSRAFGSNERGVRRDAPPPALRGLLCRPLARPPIAPRTCRQLRRASCLRFRFQARSQLPGRRGSKYRHPGPESQPTPGLRRSGSYSVPSASATL